MWLFNFWINDFKTLAIIFPVLKEIPIGKITAWNSTKLNPIENTYTGAMFTYFLLGGLIFKYKTYINKINTFLLIVCFIFGMILHEARWYLFSANSNKNIENIFLGYFTTPVLLSTIVTFIFFFKFFNKPIKNKYLNYFFIIISQNTLAIYYIHWIIGSVFFKYLRNILNILNIPSCLCIHFLISIFLALISAIIGIFIKKIPFISYLLK